MLKNVFAIVGAMMTLFSLLGALGIGHFRFYYGSDVQGCAKMEAAKPQPSQYNESE